MGEGSTSPQGIHSVYSQPCWQNDEILFLILDYIVEGAKLKCTCSRWHPKIFSLFKEKKLWIGFPKKLSLLILKSFYNVLPKIVSFISIYLLYLRNSKTKIYKQRRKAVSGGEALLLKNSGEWIYSFAAITSRLTLVWNGSTCSDSFYRSNRSCLKMITIRLE